jgi:SAM-dependent methyltransferase
MQTDPKAFGQEYFERIYRRYEAQNPLYKLAFYQRLVSHWAPACVQPRILDMGCAFGTFLACLDSRWSKYGVDISDYAIAIAREKAPEAAFAEAGCTESPFKGPFEAIVSFDVLEHVPDLEPVAAYVCEALAPEGVFVFVVPVYDGPLGWLVNLLDPDPTHIHKRSRKFWLSWAGKHFQVEEWRGIFRYLLPHGPYVNWPTRWWRYQAPAIAVVARKCSSGPVTGNNDQTTEDRRRR